MNKTAIIIPSRLDATRLPNKPLKLIKNKEMIDTIDDKKELSKKLKERAILEGFTIAGIASIPGSSRIKLRNNALELSLIHI